MKSIKQLITGLPEYYLLVLVLLSGYTPPLAINPLAIGLAAILILQIIFKNKATGLAIAGLFILINLYMAAAMISEFNEFATFNADARQLLLVGSSLFILNSVAAGAMVYKYAQIAARTKLEEENGA